MRGTCAATISPGLRAFLLRCYAAPAFAEAAALRRQATVPGKRVAGPLPRARKARAVDTSSTRKSGHQSGFRSFGTSNLHVMARKGGHPPRLSNHRFRILGKCKISRNFGHFAAQTGWPAVAGHDSWDGKQALSSYHQHRQAIAPASGLRLSPRRAGLAQLVEHVICNHGVTGSNPVAGTNEIDGLLENRQAWSRPKVTLPSRVARRHLPAALVARGSRSRAAITSTS